MALSHDFASALLSNCSCSNNSYSRKTNRYTTRHGHTLRNIYIDDLQLKVTLQCTTCSTYHGKFLPSRQMCNMNAESNLKEFSLQNVYLKEVLVCILLNFKL